MLSKIWEILNSYPPEQFQLNILGSAEGASAMDKIAKYIFGAVISISEFFQKVMLTTPVAFLRTDEFWRLYSDMIYLSFALLAVVLMWNSILKLKGYNINMEAILYRVFFFPVIVGVAPHLVIRFIIIFNKLTAMIINLESLSAPNEANFSTLLGCLFFLSVIGLLLLRLILWYFKKIVWMVFYTMIIPIVLVIRCVPQYENIGHWLLDQMLRLMITQVAHALVMSILGTIILGVSQFSLLMSLGFQMGALFVMGELESKITEALNTSSNITGGSLSDNYKTIKKRYKEGKEVKDTIKSIISIFKKGGK